MHVYACVRPQVFTATPRCTSPLANSPLSRKGADEGRRESLPSSIPSRKGKGVIIRGSYGPSIHSINFQLFSPFFVFYLSTPFYPPLLHYRYMEIRERYAARLIASPSYSIFDRVIYGGNMQSRAKTRRVRSSCDKINRTQEEENFSKYKKFVRVCI